MRTLWCILLYYKGKKVAVIQRDDGATVHTERKRQRGAAPCVCARKVCARVCWCAPTTSLPTPPQDVDDIIHENVPISESSVASANEQVAEAGHKMAQNQASICVRVGVSRGLNVSA